MSSRPAGDEVWPSPVKIPADVDREDTVLGPLTARQALRLGAVALVLWLGYQAARPFVPLLFCAAAALPVATAAVLAVLTRRDGLALDRWLAEAVRHRRTPRRLAPTARPGQDPNRLRLPVAEIAPDGTVGLGPDGCAVLAEAGTVNFALRTGGEQQALIAGFGRWLNSLTGPVQVLVRTQPLDTAPAVLALRRAAPGLPHPLLEQACLAHAEFLAELAEGQDLLHRRVLLVHREPGTDRGAAARVLRRAEESTGLLAACEAAGRVLDGSTAYGVLAAACDPGIPVHPRPALPHSPVTAAEGAPW
ncbi:PrgI family protein [Kitasatospora arboriphila]|uniref:PrgI family protein n=1 Tax=Kitasatospora arboriphila TaxID=258052 RepID=A0ABN1TGC7_9ACTN